MEGGDVDHAVEDGAIDRFGFDGDDEGPPHVEEVLVLSTTTISPWRPQQNGGIYPSERKRRSSVLPPLKTFP